MFQKKINSFLYFLKINGPIDISKICFELDIPYTHCLRKGYVKEHELLCYISKVGEAYLKSLDDPSIIYTDIPEELLCPSLKL